MSRLNPEWRFMSMALLTCLCVLPCSEQCAGDSKKVPPAGDAPGETEFVVIDDDVDPSPHAPKLFLPRSKKDADGRNPRDVVVLFFQRVHERAYDDARALWTGEYLGLTEPRRTFEEFCEELRAFDQIRVGVTGRGKKGRRIVWYATYKDGKQVSLTSFTVEMEDDRWRIARGMRW